MSRMITPPALWSKLNVEVNDLIVTLDIRLIWSVVKL